MDDIHNRIVEGDCITRMNELPAGTVDLAFADPPFNIGYEYDVYDDAVEHQEYIDWSRRWISAIHRVLKPDGTFWLAIGDEYAAELKIESQKVGFHCRSWVIWYYTFGVNCARKFTRSHAHLFHLVKDGDAFTFRDRDPENRVPSARELVYNDKRANPDGRLPDDTWIIRPADAVGEFDCDENALGPTETLPPPSDRDRTFTLRPQDLEQCFTSAEDTWYFPRVAGTFKERAGFHGCQMPEQLLGRIIRTCSNAGELVLDPFSGSATTLAVAKKLGRRFLGFDLSPDYVKYGNQRLENVRVGEPLDGSPEPTKSAPSTASSTRSKNRSKKSSVNREAANFESRAAQLQEQLTCEGIVQAFRRTHEGYAVDRVIADPDLNVQFANACEQLGLFGDRRIWNMMLFRLRKAGKLSHLCRRRTSLDWSECDSYLFASEIAWQKLLDDNSAVSLDEILCDPVLADRFDRIARQFAPGYSPLQYRWAALKLRKEGKNARVRGRLMDSPTLSEVHPLKKLRASAIPKQPGLYLISQDDQDNLYAGQTTDLRGRLGAVKNELKAWTNFGGSILVQWAPVSIRHAERLGCLSRIVTDIEPRLNCRQVWSAT